MLLLLAWRNLRRNRRRTLLSALAILLGVLFLILTLEMYDYLLVRSVEESLGTVRGHARVVRRGYLKDYSPTLTLDSLPASIRKDPEVVSYSPRVRAFALLSGKEGDGGAQVLGIAPEAERRVSSLLSTVKEGEFGTLALGRGLANLLGVSVGDTVRVVKMGGLGWGMEAFPVKGILETGSPGQDAYLALGKIGDVRRMAGIREGYHEYILRLKHPFLALKWKESLKVPRGYEVVVWQEDMRGIWEIIRLWWVFKVIMAAFFYPAVLLIVFNTFAMAYYERKREFATLLAIGIGRWRLFRMLIYEVMLLALTSIALSVPLSLLVAYLLNRHPIDLSFVITNVRWEGLYISPVVSAALNPGNYVLSSVLMLLGTFAFGIAIAVGVFRLDVSRTLRERVI